MLFGGDCATIGSWSTGPETAYFMPSLEDCWCKCVLREILQEGFCCDQASGARSCYNG